MLSDHWVVKSWSGDFGMNEINSPPYLAISPAYSSAKLMASGAVCAVASVCSDQIVHLGGSPDFDGKTVDFLFFGN